MWIAISFNREYCSVLISISDPCWAHTNLNSICFRANICNTCWLLLLFPRRDDPVILPYVHTHEYFWVHVTWKGLTDVDLMNGWKLISIKRLWWNGNAQVIRRCLPKLRCAAGAFDQTWQSIKTTRKSILRCLKTWDLLDNLLLSFFFSLIVIN